MSLDKTDICELCQNDSDTFMYLYVKCRYVVELRKDLENWTHSNLGESIKYLAVDIILQNLYMDNQYIAIDTLIATAKYYILKVL